MARKGKQSLAETVDEDDIIIDDEISSEPNIIIDDNFGIRGKFLDYALVTKKVAHRTGKKEDGDNEGKVIRYEKWDDVLYCKNIFECLHVYQEVTNLSKIKALNNSKDFNVVEKIFKDTNRKIDNYLQCQTISKEADEALNLLDTINQLKFELKEAKEVIKDANDFKKWLKEKKQIIIKDVEPTKHRMKLEK